MSRWIDDLGDCQARDRPCVLITLAAIEGSSPREPGAKMVVTAEAASGTLGGGTVEKHAEERAREMLDAGTTAPELLAFTLNDALDQACGGRMQLLFEPLWPATLQIALFGAGHVGRALVHVLSDTPCRIRWFDPRPDVFPANLPGNVSAAVSERPQEAVAELPGGTILLAMTHSHDLDLAIIDAALHRSDLAFIGSIGSATKRGRFRSRLAERGHDATAIERLTIPIGLAGVGGKQPAEIAIAVAAQVLRIRDEG